MIFFLGTLGIINCFFVPGLLIYNKINGSTLFKFITVILVSIFFNYLLITLLLFLKIYIKEILYIIFIIEIFLLFKFLKLENFVFNIKFDIYFFIILGVISLILFGLYKNTGNVFYAWDAVVSYNEWAIKFSDGQYPAGMIRPYLLPKLWSFIYIFSDNNALSLFAKFTTIIFPSLIFLISLDELITYKKLQDFFKLILFCIFFYFKKNFILTGYVDIPLTAIVYSFFYYFRKQEINFSILSILIGFTIKFSSIFVLLFFLISKKKYLLKKFFLIFLIFLYFIFLYQSKLDNFFSKAIFNEMGQADNFNLYSIFKYSLFILKQNNLIYFLFIPTLGVIINSFTRNLLFIFVLPGLIYWSLLLSYDDRNFLFLIPGLIILNSIILEKLFLKVTPKSLRFLKFIDKKFFKTISVNINSKLIFISIILLISSTAFVDDQAVINKNVKKQNEMIGNKKINLKLIELIDNKKLTSETFITDFQLIFFIPAFKNYFSWNNNFLSKNTKNLDQFDYYLIYGHSNYARKIISQRIEKDEIKLILDINGFILAGVN